MPQGLRPRGIGFLTKGTPARWNALAFGGLIVFVGRAVLAARHQVPVLDEGTYLLKGLLFARGVYQPFQPNGPWTNHMPLSFLIPGFIQKWFGPGLATGRYAAILAAALAVAAMWLVVRQMTGEKWAAGAVWALAAMPAAAKIYSLAVSEAFAAMLFMAAVWALTTPSSRTWRLVAGGLFAGALTMTRLNMAVAWVALGLFATVMWRRRSVWFWGASLAVVLGLHAVYWPRIMWLWARWLPAAVPLPETMRPPLHDAPRVYQAAGAAWTRAEAFWNAVRAFPLAWAGLAAGTTAAFTAAGQRFARVWLAGGVALAWALVLLHGWASISGDYCIDCFTLYTGFYAPFLVALGGVGLGLPWARGAREGGFAWLTAAAVFAVAAATNAAGFIVAVIDALRARGLPYGWLASLLYWPQIHVFPHAKPVDAARMFWGLLALAGAVVVVAVLWARRRPARAFGAGQKALWLALAAALLVLSPLPLFSGGWGPYDCPDDVLPAHARAAAALARVLPAGAKVYWASYDATLLLNAQGLVFAPQQLNNGYNWRRGGDAAALASWGYWNQALDAQWLAEADVAVLDVRHWEAAADALQAHGFVLRAEVPFATECTRERTLMVASRAAP